MPITASSAQLVGLPTIGAGNNAISANFSLSLAGTTHTALDISGTQLVALAAAKFGALVSETLTIQVSFDGGTNFRDFKTYTFAEINVANGFYRVEQVKGTHIRGILNNPQSGIGLNLRYFI